MPHYKYQPDEPSAANFSPHSPRSGHCPEVKREHTPLELPDWTPSPVDSIEEHTSLHQFHSFARHRLPEPQADLETMSGTQNAPKLGLNARAAELKEKLVRQKVGTQTSPTRFVPHPLPQVPTKTAVKASAKDIAALITSISSNMAEDGKQGGQIPGPDTARPAGKSDGTSVSNSGVAPAKVTGKAEPKGKGPASTWPGAASINSFSPTSSGSEQLANQLTETPAVHGINRAREPPKMNQLANSGGNGKSDESVDRKGGAADQAQEITANTTSVKGALDRILDNDADLRDWLVLTNYYDMEARNRKLTRHRRAMALAAERERIEEEERKLREEEALEMGFRVPITAPSKSDTPLQTPVSQPGSSVFSMPATTETTTEQPEPAPLVPAKRAHSPERESPEKAGARPEKMARREPALIQPSEPKTSIPLQDSLPGTDMFKDSQYQPRLLSPVRDPSPRRNYRASPPRREYSPKRPTYAQPPRGPRDPRDQFADKPQSEYDSYKGEGVRHYREPSPHRGGRQFSPRRPTSEGQFLDLGRPGETRFFIIKSFNEDNVRMCMEDGVWATQTRNGQILTRAFASCKNVILFFSINKSRAFQGFARMSTTPSPDTPRPSWMKHVHWDSSPPFRVEWLSKVPVMFSRINNLKNSYNDDHPVLVGKDGQEVEDRCGRDLLRVMQETAAASAGKSGHHSFAPGHESEYSQYGMGRGNPASPQQKQKSWYPSYRGGKRGGYRGGYRGGHRQEGGRAIKEEDPDLD